MRQTSGACAALSCIAALVALVWRGDAQGASLCLIAEHVALGMWWFAAREARITEGYIEKHERAAARHRAERLMVHGEAWANGQGQLPKLHVVQGGSE